MINQKKNIKISVIGQGYVGLPMSIVLATKCKNYKILGIEKNNSRGNYLKELINNKLSSVVKKYGTKELINLLKITLGNEYIEKNGNNS